MLKNMAPENLVVWLFNSYFNSTVPLANRLLEQGEEVTAFQTVLKDYFLVNGFLALFLICFMVAIQTNA